MPFAPGERLDWIPTHSDPDSTVFVLLDGPDEGDLPLTTLSVANGGLEQRRKGALHPVFTAPSKPGRYRYEWRVNGKVDNAGMIRINERREHRHTQPNVTEASAGQPGVQARRR